MGVVKEFSGQLDAPKIKEFKGVLDGDPAGETPTLGDLGRTAVIGLVGDTARGLGYGLEKMGVDYGRRMREGGDDLERQMVEGMTPGGRRAYEGKIFEGEGVSDLALSDTWGRSAIMQGVRSIPQMVTMALPGGAVSKAISSIPVVSRAAQGGNKLAQWAPGALGFGGAEGVQAAAINAAQTKSRIEQFDEKALSKSPRMAEIMETLPASVPFAERFQQARKQLSEEAADEVFRRTAVWTGGVGVITGGGVLGALERGAGRSLPRAVGGGALTEAVQETPQSFGEHVIQQAAEQRVDPNIDPWKGAPAAGLSGGVVGGATGGVFGGGGYAAHRMSGGAPEGEEKPITDRVRELVAGLRGHGAGAVPAGAGRERVRTDTEKAVQRMDKAAQEALKPAPEGLGGDTGLERYDALGAEIAALRSPEQAGAPAAQGERLAALEGEREAIAKGFPKMTPGAEIGFSTESNVKLGGRFALAEMDELTASHGQDMKENPRYPRALQPRDRAAAGYEVQVAKIAAQLNPERLGASPDVATGAPIVGRDGIVESGNGRVIALERAYREGGEAAQRYRAWLAANAGQFGIDPASLKQMKAPVLVRVRETPVNRAEFARQANAPTTAQMAPLDLARADAKRMGSLEGLVADESGNFMTPANDALIRGFFSSLPITEQTGMVDKSGRISQAGQRRFQNSLLVKAYGDASPTLVRMVESLDDTLRGISSALVKSAPALARAREGIKAGAMADRDITADVVRAVDEVARLRAEKRSVAEFLAQSGMFQDISPVALELVQFIDANVRAPNQIARFIENYLGALAKYGAPGQEDMFGSVEAPSTEDIARSARKETEDAGSDEGAAGPVPAIEGGAAAAVAAAPAGAGGRREEPSPEPAFAGGAIEQRPQDGAPGEAGGVDDVTQVVRAAAQKVKEATGPAPEAAAAPKREKKKVAAEKKLEQQAPAETPTPEKAPATSAGALDLGSSAAAADGKTVPSAIAETAKPEPIKDAVVGDVPDLLGGESKPPSGKFLPATRRRAAAAIERIKTASANHDRIEELLSGRDHDALWELGDADQIAALVDRAVSNDPALRKAILDPALKSYMNPERIARARGEPPVEAGIDATALEAATSPQNDLPEPSDAQKETGNYQKGHITVAGLEISIENPEGSKRRPEWPTLKQHYGYIKGTVGRDKDHVDVFVKPGTPEDWAGKVFVIDQTKANGQFDEHKVMLGFPTKGAARSAYLENYTQGWNRIGSIARMDLASFKKWVFDQSEAGPRGGERAQDEKAEKPTRGSITEQTVLRDAASRAGEPTAKRTATAIADFGEKIGGARKDVWQSFKDRLRDAQEVDVLAEPLSKSWPEPDYQAMLEEGADSWAVAFMHAARDEIPPKPRVAWKVKTWAESVTLLRDTAIGLADGTISVEKAKGLLANMASKSRGMNAIASRIELYQLVGHSKSLAGVRIAVGSYGLFEGKEYNPRKTIWTVEKKTSATALSNWPRMLATGSTKEEAMQDFKEKFASLALSEPVARETTFEIFSKRGENGYYIGKKLGRNPILLAGPIQSIKEARAYKDEHREELIAKLAKAKEIPNTRRDTNEPRVGEDMRSGKDVTPALFAETFGFRGVEFGNWVENDKRQQDLNDAFDALMDMAAILDVPPKALSLNGELGLAFGARGTGGVEPAKAHYEHEHVVINLTKKAGAGSIGHEWWHALDNYFSRMRGKKDDFLTEGLDVGLSARGSNYAHQGQVRKEMVDAFGAVVRAIRETALKARSSKLDARRSREYWTTGHEMSARAFESYLISKLQDQGASNDYLANIVDEQTWKAAESMGFELDGSYPYPTAGEIPQIRAAFDHFFQTVETKETDKGVAIYSEAARAVPEERWLSVATLTQIAEERLGQFAHQPPVFILDRASDVDPAFAGKSIAGVTWRGRIYLVREGIENDAAATRTLWHELLHYGLRRFMTREQYIAELTQLYARDAWIRERAKAWMASDEAARLRDDGASEGYLRARGVDEALAELAEINQGDYRHDGALAGAYRAVARWVAQLAERLGFREAAERWRGVTNDEARELIRSAFSKLREDAPAIASAGANILDEPRPGGDEPMAPMASRQSENISDYKLQSRAARSGEPMFWNGHIIFGRPSLEANAEYVDIENAERTVSYRIYDPKAKNPDGSSVRLGVARVVLDWQDRFKEVQLLAVDKPFRRGQGWGETVIASILAHNGPGYRMRIYDIQHHTGNEWDALPFWLKMGTRTDRYSTDPNSQINGVLTLEGYLRERGAKSRLSRRGVLQEALQPARPGDEAQDRQSDAGRAGEGPRRGRPVLEGRAGVSGSAEQARANQAGVSKQQFLKIAAGHFGDGIHALFATGLFEFAENGDGLPNPIRGRFQSGDEAWYDPDAMDGKGTIYFIGSEISPKRVVPLILHELGEHYGLPRMLGEDGYARVLESVRGMRDTSAEVAAAWAFVQRNYPDEAEGSDRFVSEVIAKIGETAAGRRMPFFRRLIAAIRRFLISIGFDPGLVGQLTHDDIAEMVVASARAVVQAAEATAYAARPIDYRQMLVEHGVRYEVRASERENSYRAKTPEAGPRDVRPASQLPSEEVALQTFGPVKVGYHRLAHKRIDTPEKAAHAFADLRKSPREKFIVLGLDENDKPVAAFHLFAGTMTQTSVYPREIVTLAYSTPGIKKLWFGHNHPNGSEIPSRADEMLTQHIKQSFGPSLGIEVAGHIIVAGRTAVMFDVGTNGETLDRRTFAIEPALKSFNVPILERSMRMNRGEPGNALTSPGVVRDFLERAKFKTAGFVLLNANYRVQGWYPMALEEMAKLRTGDADTGGGKLFAMVAKYNPAALIAWSPTPSSLPAHGERELDRVANAVNNAAAALANIDVKVLDAFLPHTEDTERSLLSLSERGLVGDAEGGQPFASRQIREEGIPEQAGEVLSEFDNDAPLKAHADYKAAKAGDSDAAVRLVKDLVSPASLRAATERWQGATFVPVMAKEATGHNQIPNAMAMAYANAAAGFKHDNMVQSNEAHHTGARPLERMAIRPVFDGPVLTGERYVLVDDVTTMGGTLAELADHIRAGGGEVIGVATIVNAARTGDTIRTAQRDVLEIERRFGHAIEELFNAKPAALTRAEARYLLNFKDADALRASVAKARAERSDRLDAKGIPGGEGKVRRGPQASRYAPDLFGEPGQDFAGHRASWDAPEASKLDDVLYTMQDKHIDTRRVLEAIKRRRGVSDKADVYLQEELFHGRAANAVDVFLRDEMKPLLTAMTEAGVRTKEQIAEFEKFLHARHAEERNIQIAKVNPNMPDGGSGIATQDAKDYMAGLAATQAQRFQALAARVDAINAETRQLLITYGLESTDAVKAWEDAYKHYVPLQRADMDSGLGIGQGYSVKGPASKRATGSKRKVVDILANIAMQRERAIVRGEKNRVANALIGLASINENTEFWKVDQPPKIRYINETTGLVEEMVDPLYKTRPNVVVARMPDGKGGITEHSVVFNEDDERAVRMAQALKNLDMDDLGHVLGMAAKITRYFAAINTQYNPVFGVINFVRDSQGALFNLSTTAIAGKQVMVLQNAISALRGIYIDARDTRLGKEPTSSWAQLWEEFQKAGGQTGYRDMFRTSKDRAEAIERELKRISEGKAKHVGRAVFDWLSDYNTAMENAIRLSAYKVAKDSGMTEERAASLAKNLTVNFNRKGQIATQTGALYAFFNASVQGTARLTETLRGPMGKKIMAGGVLLGVAQALLLAAAGFGDDEPPEFVRERNLILPIGNGKYLTLAMPLGLHVLPNIGRIATEFALNGFRQPGKKAAQLVGVLAEAFNPVGNAGLSLQTITPTVADPLVALAENRDWTGKAIARQDFNKLAPTPGHARAKDTASGFSKALSKALNWSTGGTNYKPGMFSPTPDQIDYLIGQVTGGLGREVIKAEQTVVSMFTGEDLPTHKIPLFGRFYGSSEGQSSQANAFYANLRTLNEHEAEIKGRRKAGEPIGDYFNEYPEARLWRSANTFERSISDMRRLRRALIERDADRETIKALDARITLQMRRFNEMVRRAKDREAA